MNPTWLGYSVADVIGGEAVTCGGLAFLTIQDAGDHLIGIPACTLCAKLTF